MSGNTRDGARDETVVHWMPSLPWHPGLTLTRDPHVRFPATLREMVAHLRRIQYGMDLILSLPKVRLKWRMRVGAKEAVSVVRGTQNDSNSENEHVECNYLIFSMSVTYSSLSAMSFYLSVRNADMSGGSRRRVVAGFGGNVPTVRLVRTSVSHRARRRSCGIFGVGNSFNGEYGEPQHC